MALGGSLPQINLGVQGVTQWGPHTLLDEWCNIMFENTTDTANGVIDILVSYDGLWQKRGHSSLYGIGIVIDILTGLIIDYEILSKYCPECTIAKRDLGENSAEYSNGTNHTKKNAAKIMYDLLMPWRLKLQKFYGKDPLKIVVCDT
ncbi:uncharacterized protein TNCV_2746551 [Trichonephila clavipes]|nr:uncharacterized protein TNCV_2746551 [Trichonephila clavipes]